MCEMPMVVGSVCQISLIGVTVPCKSSQCFLNLTLLVVVVVITGSLYSPNCHKAHYVDQAQTHRDFPTSMPPECGIKDMNHLFWLKKQPMFLTALAAVCSIKI